MHWLWRSIASEGRGLLRILLLRVCAVSADPSELVGQSLLTVREVANGALGLRCTTNAYRIFKSFNRPAVGGLPSAWQRGSSCELLCGWKVDGDLRHAVKVVADRLVADDHDRIDQIGLRPTSAEERVSRLRRNMSALLGDLTDEAGERVP